ncbi:unnamed protein product [Urochloa humidicola]
MTPRRWCPPPPSSPLLHIAGSSPSRHLRRPPLHLVSSSPVRPPRKLLFFVPLAGCLCLLPSAAAPAPPRRRLLPPLAYGSTAEPSGAPFLQGCSPEPSTKALHRRFQSLPVPARRSSAPRKISRCG